MEDNITKKKMTIKMLKFCENYLDTRNATQAYAEAYGYDVKSKEGKEKYYNSVSTNGYKLLQDPRIKEYLESRMLEMNYERDLSEKEIIMQLNKIALSGHFKENTRLEALKMLSRMKGMYDDEEKDQSITINLSSDLQNTIEQNRRPNPRILDVTDSSEE